MTNERAQCNAAGQVVLKLKTPWHDDATHSGMSPAEFTQRLAALMPRPRLTIDVLCAPAYSASDCFAATNLGQ